MLHNKVKEAESYLCENPSEDAKNAWLKAKDDLRGSFKKFYLLLQNFVNVKASNEFCHLCSCRPQLYIHGKSNLIPFLLLSLHGKDKRF